MNDNAFKGELPVPVRIGRYFVFKFLMPGSFAGSGIHSLSFALNI